MLDLAKILISGLVLGLLVGKLVSRNPHHIKRLRLKYWRRIVKKMKRRQWVRIFMIALWCGAGSLVISTFAG